MPTETIAPEATETATEYLTRAFDKVAPMPKGSEQIHNEPVKPAVESPAQTPKAPEVVSTPSSTDKPLPSFLESKPEIKIEEKEEPWPEEIPGEKDPKKQADYKKWRTQYETRGQEIKRLKAETEELRQKTGSNDPEIQSRIKKLETENGQYKERFDKVYVENSDWYQNTFVKPREEAVNRAKNIVKDVGGDADAMDKLLMLKGKLFWDALEEVTAGIPEVAKVTLTNLVSGIQTGDQKRDEVLSQSREAAEGLRKQELQGQKQFIEKDINETRSVFQEVIADMRGKGLEVLQKTNDPKAQWWNTDIVEKIEKGAEDTIFNSPDKRRHIAAIILGHSADQYRSLWIEQKDRADKLQSIQDAMDATSPNLEDTGGGMPSTNGEDDTKKPIGDLFKSILENQAGRK